MNISPKILAKRERMKTAPERAYKTAKEKPCEECVNFKESSAFVCGKRCSFDHKHWEPAQSSTIRSRAMKRLGHKTKSSYVYPKSRIDSLISSTGNDIGSLSKAIGIEHYKLYDLSAGSVKCTEYMAHKLGKFFNVDPQWILSKTDTEGTFTELDEKKLHVLEANAKKMKKGFPKRIEHLLKEKGLTKRSLAKMLGSCETTVSSWTTGRSDPGAHTMALMAVRLEMTKDEFWDLLVGDNYDAPIEHVSYDDDQCGREK